MARSDGHGARPGHPAARRPAHQLDQPGTEHYGEGHGEEPAGWPDRRDFGGQYSQEPYWQQPPTPQGYEPVPPDYPSLDGGLGHPIEPIAPDLHYPGEPQHNPYSGGQDSYHYPQEPVFNPYEPTPPQPRAPDLAGADGYGAQGFGSAGFPPFQEPAPSGFPLPNGYAEHDEYAPQYDPAYPPAREPQLNPFPGAQHHQPQSAGGQFHDYMDQDQPLAEKPGASDYPGFNQPARFDNERAGLRGSDFEDWPRSDDALGHGQGGYEPSSQFGPAAAAHGGYAEHDWQQNDNSYPLDSGPIFASAGYDTAQDLALHSEYEEDEYDEYEEDEEEPAKRSRGRIGWILMALAAAVMIGGTLAYGYKILLGPAATEVAQTPLVKSNSEPPKVRPDDPGGRSFDHTDSKVLGRLSEQRNANSEQLADDGSRRVSTVVIGRDGDIVTPRDAPTPTTPPPANPVVSVPGLTLVDGFGGRQPAAPAVASASQQQPIVVQPPPSNAMPPANPVVAARSEPAPRNSDLAAPPPAAKPAEVERAPAQRTAALAPPKANPPVTTASTTPPAAESAGYVAVLASVPVSASSRVDALAQYADIQQNYASVLGARTPDVREANLGSRGRFHRLMVGPPGSKENAADLCAQLKTAGYSGCWITTY